MRSIEYTRELVLTPATSYTYNIHKPQYTQKKTTKKKKKKTKPHLLHLLHRLTEKTHLLTHYPPPPSPFPPVFPYQPHSTLLFNPTTRSVFFFAHTIRRHRIGTLHFYSSPPLLVGLNLRHRPRSRFFPCPTYRKF